MAFAYILPASAFAVWGGAPRPSVFTIQAVRDVGGACAWLQRSPNTQLLGGGAVATLSTLPTLVGTPGIDDKASICTVSITAQNTEGHTATGELVITVQRVNGTHSLR